MDLVSGGGGGRKLGKSFGLTGVIDPGIGVNGFARMEGAGLVGLNGGGAGGGCDGGAGIIPTLGPKSIISISSPGCPGID